MAVINGDKKTYRSQGLRKLGEEAIDSINRTEDPPPLHSFFHSAVKCFCSPSSKLSIPRSKTYFKYLDLCILI